MIYAEIQCKCGWRREGNVASEKLAEVQADEHESRDVRRPHRHNTSISYKEAK